MDKNECRVHQRFAAELSVDIRQIAFQMNTQAQCRDISAGGVGVVAGEKITPNTRIGIRLEIPSRETPIRSLGRVVWTEKIEEMRWRMGLEFEQADFERIRGFFERT